jgi:hypothetical protein
VDELVDDLTEELDADALVDDLTEVLVEWTEELE